ncbi:MAG: ABC transporter substrate-binding protein [Clostridiales bacterium]|jgi:iron complex transport system substrate-binding protein|nr:ABC transporter substrate-binding protein [Clostridiales bacterium]
MKSRLILFCIFILIFTSCKGDTGAATDNSASTGFPITVTDVEGISTVIEKAPERVISLTPGVTENIYLVGGIENLVGRSDFCDNPPEVLDLPATGTLYEPNNEIIASLNPDLIIAGAHTNPDKLQALRNLGFNVIRQYEDSSLDSLFETLVTIGEVMGKKPEAEEAVTKIKASIGSVSEKVKDLPKPTVYYCISAGDDGDFTAGGNTFINTIIEIAGGDNIAKGLEGWAYSKEALIEADPEIIIVGSKSGLLAQLPQMEGYKDLSAVKGNKVYAINEDLIDRYSGYIDGGVLELAEIFHPGAF